MGNSEEIKGSRIFEECSQTFPNIINVNIYVNSLGSALRASLARSNNQPVYYNKIQPLLSFHATGPSFGRNETEKNQAAAGNLNARL